MLFNQPLQFGGNYSSGLRRLKFVSDQDTITPTITLSGGAPTPDWEVTEADGTKYYYDTASISHTRTDSGYVTVKLLNSTIIADYVTKIDFNNDGIISSFWNLNIDLFKNLSIIELYNNAITGDLTNWRISNNLTNLHIDVNQLTGDLSQWILPSGLTYFNVAANGFTGDLSQWILPSGLTTFNVASNGFDGDIGSWIIPSNMTLIHIGANEFSGDLSSWTLPNTELYLYAYSCNLTGGPVLQSASSIRTYLIDNNNLDQAAVDAICSNVYTYRAGFTYSTPVFNVAGTNAAPSGTYQDATPPTTGKEYIYKLVNDPDTEGFNKQTWTYNA